MSDHLSGLLLSFAQKTPSIKVHSPNNAPTISLCRQPSFRPNWKRKARLSYLSPVFEIHGGYGISARILVTIRFAILPVSTVAFYALDLTISP